MKFLADDWLKTLLNGVLIGAIVFLSFLPALGWTWHSVLPEHTHAFIGIPHAHTDEEEITSTPPPFEEPDVCTACPGTQISRGVVHLPGSFGLQVLGIAGLGALLFVFLPPDFSSRIIIFPIFYRSPALTLQDPPPNTNG